MFVVGGAFRLIVISSLLSGCATVGGTRQTISFDSYPRGLNLSVQSGGAGETPSTPFTAEVGRARELSVDFRSGDFVQTKKISCSYRFGTSLFGNLALSALSYTSPVSAGLIFLTGAGIDYLNGSAFECPKMIAADVSVPEAVRNELHETCSPILILPPKLAEDDPALTFALVSEAKNFAGRFDSHCHTSVSPSETVAAFNRSSFSGLSFDELFLAVNEKKLVQILRDTRASRGIDMRIVRRNGAQVGIKFRLLDLYKKSEISSFQKSFSKHKFEHLQSGILMRALGRSIRLFPNSFALSTSRPQLLVEAPFAVSQEVIRREGLVGLMSMTSVQHPDQYEAWDYGFELGPSVFFDSIQNRISPDMSEAGTAEFFGASRGNEEKIDFTGYALSVPIDASISLHTPAGALRVSLGLGLGLYKSTSAQSAEARLISYPLSHIGMGWVAYFSRNAFFQVGLHSFRALKIEQIEQRKSVSFKNWGAVVLGLGYYFPNTQAYLSSWLASQE